MPRQAELLRCASATGSRRSAPLHGELGVEVVGAEEGDHLASGDLLDSGGEVRAHGLLVGQRVGRCGGKPLRQPGGVLGGQGAGDVVGGQEGQQHQQVLGRRGVPNMAAYAASKFAVRGFSEALRHELEGSGVGVTVVHPGGVNTSIAEKARVPAGATEEEIERRLKRYRKLLRLPPAIAAETIVRGIERRQSRVMIGSDAKVISLIVRLLPVSYWRVLLAMRGGD